MQITVKNKPIEIHPHTTITFCSKKGDFDGNTIEVINNRENNYNFYQFATQEDAKKEFMKIQKQVQNSRGYFELKILT
jgi:hypothetical protein